jgi:hypothetical protein
MRKMAFTGLYLIGLLACGECAFTDNLFHGLFINLKYPKLCPRGRPTTGWHEVFIYE